MKKNEKVSYRLGKTLGTQLAKENPNVPAGQLFLYLMEFNSNTPNRQQYSEGIKDGINEVIISRRKQ